MCAISPSQMTSCVYVYVCLCIHVACPQHGLLVVHAHQGKSASFSGHAAMRIYTHTHIYSMIYTRCCKSVNWGDTYIYIHIHIHTCSTIYTRCLCMRANPWTRGITTRTGVWDQTGSDSTIQMYHRYAHISIYMYIYIYIYMPLKIKQPSK
jgi:hypothetical protein